jgi:hypothetical protein
MVFSPYGPRDVRAKGRLTMKRILLFTMIGSMLLLFSAPGAWAFGVKDVVKMTDDGIPDSLIILKIQNSGKTFHLNGKDMHELHKDGVSDEVISAMLRTEGRDREEGYYDGYYDHAGYYYYPYYSYPYSRVYLGFGYGSGRYHSPYYGGYRRYGGYQRYQPYSPYSGNYGTTRYRGTYGTRLQTGSSGGYTGGSSAPSAGTRSGSGGGGGSRTRTRTR